LRNFLRKRSSPPNAANPADNLKSSQEARMTESDIAWWASFWGKIETWAFLGVVLTLAIEFAALKLGAPYKEKLEAAKDLKIVELNKETAQLRRIPGPRDINFDVFKKELEGKPKAPVVIWYLPDTFDGFWFASKLSGALRISDWQVLDPTPTPIPEPDSSLPPAIRNMPRAALATAGQYMGVTVVGDGDDSSMRGNTPYRALFDALRKGTNLTSVSGAGGSQFMPVPKGTLRVVVAAKAEPKFIEKPANAPASTNPK